ncbi:MAG: hypothetical protein PW843_08400 [Azospirillaceae bacterium]|nr:hypothetical protein [Azospirillaceae bacterium]
MFALLKKSSLKMVAVAAASSSLAILVTTAPLPASANEVTVTPVVYQACQSMGLHPANSDFAACTSVLNRAREEHIRTVSPQVAKEEQACAQAGVAPGSAQFASCVDNLDAALTQQTLMAN